LKKGETEGFTFPLDDNPTDPMDNPAGAMSGVHPAFGGMQRKQASALLTTQYQYRSADF